MSVTFAQSLPTIPRPQRLYSFPVARNRTQILNFADSPLLGARGFAFVEKKSYPRRIRALPAGESIDGNSPREVSGELNLDAFLSVTEILLIIPPAIYSIWYVVSFLIHGAAKPLPASLGSKSFVCQLLLLVGSVAVGSLIRRRQWRRICRESESGACLDLLTRIEKVEEDLKSSSTMVRVLSRQLEKLGIRFRVTRKSLMEPLTQTTALAQRNSEATRALAMQEDILEKELGEIQKVLLAMQEQQQRQLELILAIAKAGKHLDSKRDTSVTMEQSTTGNTESPVPDKQDGKQFQIQMGKLHKTNNDRA